MCVTSVQKFETFLFTVVLIICFTKVQLFSWSFVVFHKMTANKIPKTRECNYTENVWIKGRNGKPNLLSSETFFNSHNIGWSSFNSVNNSLIDSP